MNIQQYNQSCAVCGGPGEPDCNCEGERLQQCINQAEKAWIESWMVKTRYDHRTSCLQRLGLRHPNIHANHAHREWVTNQAINAITAVFNKKKEARKAMFEAQLSSIPYWPQFQQYRGRPPLHPHIIADIQRRMAEADLNLKRGIDYDWKNCVIRYPDVLGHFYQQVKIMPPREPESPFGTALAGGGAPRPPSVVNIPRPQAAPPSIMRSATAPPKKQRRTSKVNMELDMNEEFKSMLTNQLEGLSRTSTIGGRTKTATPAPQASTPAPRAQRPGGKRRESKDFSIPRSMQMPPPPPHVPQPPMNFGNRPQSTIYEAFR